MKDYQFFAILSVLIGINSNVTESPVAELLYSLVAIGLMIMAILSYHSDKS